MKCHHKNYRVYGELCEQKENQDEYYSYRPIGCGVPWSTSGLAVQRSLGIFAERRSRLPVSGIYCFDVDGPNGTGGNCKAVMEAGIRS